MQTGWQDAARCARWGFIAVRIRERIDEHGAFDSDVDDGAFALLDYPGAAGRAVSADATTAVESYTCAIHGERRTAVASGPRILDLTLYAVDPNGPKNCSANLRHTRHWHESIRTFRR